MTTSGEEELPFARDDEELLAAFIDCTLPHAEWTHTAHVRVAYLHVRRLSPQAALEEFRRHLKRYNASTQTPEKIDRGYHETITRAFVLLIADRAANTDTQSDSRAFCDQFPELLSKRLLLEYYSRHRIMSWEAKITYVEPDRKPLQSGNLLSDDRRS